MEQTTRWGREAGRWGIDPRTGELVVIIRGIPLPTTDPAEVTPPPTPPPARGLGYLAMTGATT